MKLAQLRSFFSAPSQKREALALYIALVQQSRNPFFYEHCAVPDTLDGRFDIIVLHLFLALRSIAGGAPPPGSFHETSPAGSSPEPASADSLLLRVPLQGQKEFSRLLLECLFDDMDQSLREMGVGDMGVGKRIKVMSKAVFGRLQAYEDAYASDDAFAEAIGRNIYRGSEVGSEQLTKIVKYIRNYSDKPIN